MHNTQYVMKLFHVLASFFRFTHLRDIYIYFVFFRIILRNQYHIWYIIFHILYIIFVLSFAPRGLGRTSSNRWPASAYVQHFCYIILNRINELHIGPPCLTPLDTATETSDEVWGSVSTCATPKGGDQCAQSTIHPWLNKVTIFCLIFIVYIQIHLYVSAYLCTYSTW